MHTPLWTSMRRIKRAILSCSWRARTGLSAWRRQRYGEEQTLITKIFSVTSLHFCCAYGFTELAAYLISKGADAALENSYGSLCTEGLAKAALQLIEDAQEQRQQREADGEDLDTASIYTATDRSQIEEDIAAGPVVDGSLVQTLEPIFDDYDESSWQYGQVEAFEEGGAEHHGDGNLVEDYEYYDQYDEGVSAEVEVESEKKGSLAAPAAEATPAASSTESTSAAVWSEAASSKGRA